MKTMLAAVALFAIVAGAAKAGDEATQAPASPPRDTGSTRGESTYSGRLATDLRSWPQSWPQWYFGALDPGAGIGAAGPAGRSGQTRSAHPDGGAARNTGGDRFGPAPDPFSIGEFEIERMPGGEGDSGGYGLRLGNGVFLGGDGVYKYFSNDNGLRLKFDVNSVSLRAARHF